ncbi:MAG: hypothetical protein NVS3B1_12580 [Marmoricola sp.]
MRRILVTLSVHMALTLSAATALFLSAAPAPAAPTPIPVVSKCAQRYTVGEYKHFVRNHYRKGKLHGPHARARLIQIGSCLESHATRLRAHRFRLRFIESQTIPRTHTGASVFSPGPDAGGPLACGGGALTDHTLGVAHKTLPCGTMIELCAARCATVPVIDRGPYVAGREFDLSSATARRIGFTCGVCQVKYRIRGRRG